MVDARSCRHQCPAAKRTAKAPSAGFSNFCFENASAAAQRFYVLPQNLIEFWNVCTRPKDTNGLGYGITLTDRLVRRFERTLIIRPDSVQIFSEWRALVIQHSVIGSSVHDARLVAGMRVHGIRSILTFDTGDFARYTGIVTLHPKDI